MFSEQPSFQPTMSHQVGTSIDQFPTQPTSRTTSPSSHFLPSPHFNHLIITLHRAWNQILIPTVYNTISQFNNSDIETPDKFANSEPSPSTFSQPPFQSIHSQVKIEPPSPPSPISYVTPTYSPLTSEPSDNNDQDYTQISHELHNFITLQQQLQHPQTLTIHQLSQSITSSNPSTSTPSSNYTPSQNPTSSSTSSSSTNHAYRTFKRKFANTPFPSNPGTTKSIVNHPLHTNTKEFLQICLPFSPNIRTSIQTPIMRNPIM